MYYYFFLILCQTHAQVSNIQQLSKKTYVTAWLRKPGDDPLQSLIPAEGVSLNFTLDGYGTLNVINNGITDADGCAMAEVDYSNYNGDTTVSTVTVSFNNPVNPDYSTETCNARYYTGPSYLDTFEDYPLNTCAVDLEKFINPDAHVTWSAGGEALSSGQFENIIDARGAASTGQSIRLYSNSSRSYIISDIDYWQRSLDSYYTMTKELRCYIRIGNRIDPNSDGTSSIELGGISLAEGTTSVKILQFKDDKEEGRKIYDANGNEIAASYNSEWYPVRIQILGNKYNTPKILKVNYWLGGEFKKSIYLENFNIHHNYYGRSISSLILSSKNNTVWFDQIEYYHDFYNWTP